MTKNRKICADGKVARDRADRAVSPYYRANSATLNVQFLRRLIRLQVNALQNPLCLPR
ncbi:hypothetical protein [Oscillatoria sp. FACHB-1406]|uniref:hypothetical protein n=1 Tax=Oscillatoria sp. FACHB-1406 TaxID=2692846 RepID=UPI001685A511|nr:hypothetical protein [Oscillatoria sp. FACHB-1406]MBD2578423.1 hypothetical protein [Oscillatoria sp. FACHB-1406]